MSEHISEIELYVILVTLEKLWKLESDTFNFEMSSSQAKQIKCSAAKVGFS